MRLATLALTCGALLLTAACNRKSETAAEAPPPAAAPAPAAPAPVEPPLAAPAGFHHQASFDASGYYVAEGVRVGNYRLTHIGVGAPSDFSQWEEGDRASVFGPILFQFEDVTSPKTADPTDGEAHAVSVRVLPQAYNLAPGKLAFKGSDPKLGEVVFVGTVDEEALAQARAEGATSAPILRGDLKVGDAPARKVALTYVVGE